MLSLASEQPKHQEITDGKDHSPFQSVDSERPSAERVENEIDESSSHAKKRKAHSASSEALALDDASGIEFIDGYEYVTNILNDHVIPYVKQETVFDLLGIG